MPVPPEIRNVERPVNTIVADSGRDGPNRYAVRERSSIKYVPGGNPKPRNGKVIGHIVDGRFVPVRERSASEGPDCLSYGAAAFVRSVSGDIMDDLLDVFTPAEAYAVMSIASLKVLRPGVTARVMRRDYGRTFVSRFWPGAAVSENSVSDLYQRLGQDGGRRSQFYGLRLRRVSDEHHLAIDGTLKQDTSTVNDLSAFSYKARTKGRKDVSLLYAYDLELMEPVCAQVFPGNSIDASSYSAFIRDNDIRRGIIIADKGFPPSRIGAELSERPALHFLTPVKRNDKRIEANGMLGFDRVLSGYDSKVTARKQAIRGGRFLYAFRDAGRAAAEEAAFLRRAREEGMLDSDRYARASRLFGVIVFESDLDMEPQTAYECYEGRWKLELVFRRYKDDECLDRTGVHGDFSVIGQEFVNFISTLMTLRMLEKARKAQLLEDRTYGELMDNLSSAWRKVDAPAEARSDDGFWVHAFSYVLEELEALGLSEPAPKPEARKRGRPRKNPVEADKPKRPRGRPRKAAAEKEEL